MKIYINNELVDIKLEKEKTFDDLYNAMRKEVEKHNKFIVDFNLKFKDYVPNNLKDGHDLLLEYIDEVYFYVGDIRDMIIGILHTQNQYVDNIGTKLFLSDELTEEEVQNIKEGSKWIKEVINILSKLFVLPIQNINIKMPEKNYENLKENLTKFLKLVKQLNVENYPNLKSEMLKSLRVIRAFSFNYFNSFLSNTLSKEELLEVLIMFERQVDNYQQRLVEINTNLQTGNDKKALEDLQKIIQGFEVSFFALMSTAERFKDQLSEEVLNEFKELIRILEDLSSALLEMDIVAVGDILEYELKDKLSIIKNYLPELKKLLTRNSLLEN